MHLALGLSISDARLAGAEDHALLQVRGQRIDLAVVTLWLQKQVKQKDRPHGVRGAAGQARREVKLCAGAHVPAADGVRDAHEEPAAAPDASIGRSGQEGREGSEPGTRGPDSMDLEGYAHGSRETEAMHGCIAN